MIFNSRFSPGEILFNEANNTSHLASAFLIPIIISPSLKPFSVIEFSLKATV